MGAMMLVLRFLWAGCGGTRRAPCGATVQLQGVCGSGRGEEQPARTSPPCTADEEQPPLSGDTPPPPHTSPPGSILRRGRKEAQRTKTSSGLFMEGAFYACARARGTAVEKTIKIEQGRRMEDWGVGRGMLWGNRSELHPADKRSTISWQKTGRGADQHLPRWTPCPRTLIPSCSSYPHGRAPTLPRRPLTQFTPLCTKRVPRLC